MPYIPDENAVIYLQASAAELHPGGRATISIHGEKGSGYPLPDGTIVYLSASRGTLPAEVTLQNGGAETEYRADEGFTSDVQIKARSGQSRVVPESLIITVADQIVAALYVWADPALLPYEGGQSRIDVLALDAMQKPVPGKIVFISTNAGTLSGGGARATDADGKVQAVLQTKKAATVTVEYKDLTCSVAIRIDSQNVMPVAVFSFSPTNPMSGETVHFNASASYDGDGRIVSYLWDFGDGASADGVTATHVYDVAASRTFVVLLKVTDNDGGVGVKTENVSVSK